MARADGSGRRVRRSMGPLLAAAVLGWMVGGAGGCKRPKKAGPPPLAVRVVRVQVEPMEDSAALAVPALGPTELAEAAQAGLLRAGVRVELAPEKAEPGDFILQMELVRRRVSPKPGTVEEGPELLRVLTAGQLRARAGSSVFNSEAEIAAQKAPELSRLQHVGVVERPVTGDQATDAAAWGPLTRRAIDESAHTLGKQLRLLSSASPSLIELVVDHKAESESRGVAAQLLAVRRERTAVPALIELLKERDRPVALRDQALGALVELGDRRAVRPLLNLARFGDSVEMGKVVEAVASLGGDEARSYLQFVAASHTDARIKGEARVALQHLEQRERRQDGGGTDKPDKID